MIQRKIIYVMLASAYMIIGVYGHFINTSTLRLPGLSPPKDHNVIKIKSIINVPSLEY